MKWDQTATFESDPRYPSGPWEGFWTQAGKVSSMKLYLEFVAGRVRGEGSDRVGAFDITGRYWPHRDRIVLRKAYHGKHTVWYRGKPFSPYLKGQWNIASPPASGLWRIWPVEDEFEITYIEIETKDGPVVIHGEVREEDNPKEAHK